MQIWTQFNIIIFKNYVHLESIPNLGDKCYVVFILNLIAVLAAFRSIHFGKNKLFNECVT